MVAISPTFNPTAAKAHKWIPIRPGTDVALALGMMNVIMKEGLCDEAFLTEYTVAPFLVREDDGLFLYATRQLKRLPRLRLRLTVACGHGKAAKVIVCRNERTS